MKKVAGFTLIEVIVVVSIVAILASVISINFNEGSAQSRDAKRQGDLRNVQSAIELYKQKEGRYPAGCRPAGQWSGQSGTAYACASGNQYIIGLAPEYIPTLPTDPKLNGDNSGYVYATNADGTVYKLMVKGTVETEVVDYDHVFKSCDATDSSVGMCDATHPTFNKPIWCQESDTTFQTTYAVWAGYAAAANDALIERYTEDIVCDIP